MQNVAVQRDVPTILRRSPVHDRQSNGLIERTVRSVEEAVRVLKLDLERRIKSEISVHEPIFGWLLQHATMALNWQQMGYDGKIPHERLVRGPLAEGFFHLAR